MVSSPCKREYIAKINGCLRGGFSVSIKGGGQGTNNYSTVNYPLGSKSEALQLGVYLILLYFIRISS